MNRLANELRKQRRRSEESNSGKDDSCSRRSPDANCPICLERIEDKSFANRCFHSFCKTCLVEWSKVKAECPVCRQTFDKILYNVKAMDDYQEQVVESRYDSSFSLWTNLDGAQRIIFRERPLAFQASTLLPFRYPTTMTPMRRRLLEMQSLLESINTCRHRLSLVISSPNAGSHASVTSTTHTTRVDDYSMDDGEADMFPPPSGTSAFRKYIYASNLWVLPFGNGDRKRFRESSAEFYRANPACTHRLLPWLNRELVALLENPMQCEMITNKIMVAITTFDIVSDEFRRVVYPHFHHRTDHFIHEFINFARSCYDMEAYSRIAIYVPKERAQIAIERETASMFRSGENVIDKEDSSSDSENSVIVVDSPESPSNNDLVSRSETESAVNSIELNINSPRNRFQITVIDDFDNPRPGPSGINLRNVFNPIAESDQDSDTEIDVGGKEDNGVNNESNESSDDSVQIIGFRKPRHERTPEIIDILESDKESAKKDDRKKEKKRKHRSRHSRSRRKYKYSKERKKRKHRSRSRSRSGYSSSSSSDSTSESQIRRCIRTKRKLTSTHFYWHSSDADSDSDSSEMKKKKVSHEEKRPIIQRGYIPSVVVSPSPKNVTNSSERETKFPQSVIVPRTYKKFESFSE
ncbi:E3 ubiquitin-protein ligase Topors-like protein [Dinothrombium tinctorium]|uniref:E3 ubiquitin-protein ligase Topors n=1 Tax=Dinothrombium tinctorium TaxID=1965070 RepID=A0A3S3NZD2_9ACAR|nr:E3 ubiquitin-protein ligase Topors-like protein [Dinothrombium tinctorium]